MYGAGVERSAAIAAPLVTAIAAAQLARKPADITQGENVSAVDGPNVVGDFGLPHQDGACDHEGQCVLLDVWADVGDHMRRYLDSYTLADCVARAQNFTGTIAAEPA